MPSHLFVAAMVAAYRLPTGCELQDDEVYLERLQKGLVQNTRIITASNTVQRFPSDYSCWRRSPLLFLLHSPIASGFDISKPMETRDIIIICMLCCLPDGNTV